MIARLFSQSLPYLADRLHYKFVRERAVLVGERRLYDLLVQLDTRDYENTRNSIQAEYNLALTNLKRLSGLRDQEIIAQSEYDSIKARVESLEANLAIAELQLTRCYISSSISGIVNKLPAKNGLYLAVGDPVATVLDIDKVKVIVGIPE